MYLGETVIVSCRAGVCSGCYCKDTNTNTFSSTNTNTNTDMYLGETVIVSCRAVSAVAATAIIQI